MIGVGASGRRTAAALRALVLCVGVAACGGGSAPSTPSQNPPPAPTPTPTPTPPPIYDTAEYRRSNAASFAGALTAYAGGATGAGIKIAIIDSGVDVDSAEFAGRIDPASRDIAGSRGIDDQSGHGTSVSAVALAAKNDSEIHGIAFASTLVALRTDTAGTCSDADGCSHADNDLASAVDIAVAAGARVINMSLGGSAANSRLRAAISNATAAGVIIVISAGNEGATAAGANPDPLAQIALDSSAARSRVLIAGAVDSAGVISTFSNRAGTGSKHYLATLGEDVRSFDHTGTPYLYGGTSYAAPGIAAAVALLAQAFPNLNADQIIEILYNSARDAGAAGIDPVYGRGILDLARAFTAQGQASLAGSASALNDDVAVTGGALGDAAKFGKALGGVIVLDRYKRAFVADLSRRVTHAAPRPKLAAALDMTTQEAADTLGGGGYGLSYTASPSRRPWVGLAQAGLDAAVNEDARITRGFVTGRVTQSSGLGVAVGYGADDLLTRLNGNRGSGSFIASGDVLRDDGLSVSGTRALALARRTGAWTIGMAAARGEAAPLVAGRIRENNDIAQFAASLSRRLGAGELTLTYSRLDEAGTILGAEGSATLGADRATSDFAGIGLAAPIGGSWTLGLTARGGLTRLGLIPGGLVIGAEALRSFAFSADVTRSGVFARGDRFALRISQPLRVEDGSVRLDVPVAYDYKAQAATIERRQATLAPSGREIDLEAAWSMPFAFGRIETNLFWRQDPGHIDRLADDLGAAVRLRARF